MFTDIVTFSFKRNGLNLNGTVLARVVDDGIADPMDDSAVSGAMREVTVFVKHYDWLPMAKHSLRVGDHVTFKNVKYRIAAVNDIGCGVYTIKARQCL